MKFDDNLFFYAILPPIIFSAGYNLKRKKFFQHFNYITLFGVVGTFVAFLAFSGLNFLLFEIFAFEKYNPETGVYSPFKLTLVEILLFSSVMCCSDTVAAVSIIKFDEQPMLFSIVFGEGIVNDAVSIILFNAVFSRTMSNVPLSWSAPLDIAGEFSSLTIYSTLLGIAGGLILALLFKSLRFMTKHPVHEIIMIFVCGFMTYLFSEMLKLSAIVSLLACGICLSHYCWYNLSP